MEKTDRDVDEFIASLPGEVRDDIATLDTLISQAFDGLAREMYEGKMWGGTDQEIVGYGTYSYTKTDKSQAEWFVVGLAVQKSHLSIYINVVEDRKYLSEKYGKELGKVKVGKSSIGFKGVADIDLDRLSDLMLLARELHQAR